MCVPAHALPERRRTSKVRGRRSLHPGGHAHAEHGLAVLQLGGALNSDRAAGMEADSNVSVSVSTTERRAAASVRCEEGDGVY